MEKHVAEKSSRCHRAETMQWLNSKNCPPIWSRMRRRNSADRYRNLPITKFKAYDIEIDGCLWSLWGSLHPKAPVFSALSRGKQYLACGILACCAATVYPLTEWNSQLLDNIIINGDKYFIESISNIKLRDYQYSLEDLGTNCTLEHIKFTVHIEHLIYGKFYCQNGKINLAMGLKSFFEQHQYGIIQSNRRSLAIGKNIDKCYFLYDCESTDDPLFPKGQGASYLLRIKDFQMLLYCILITLNIRYYNVEFSIHEVQIVPESSAQDK